MLASGGGGRMVFDAMVWNMSAGARWHLLLALFEEQTSHVSWLSRMLQEQQQGSVVWHEGKAR
jgi:hypothetical protein